jgi:hypothetical protein
MITISQKVAGVWKILYILLIEIFFLTGCNIHIKGTKPVYSYNAWTSLLQKHVNNDGLVDFKGFITDKEKLQSFLDTISANPPASNWTTNDKIAYWLNAYNAFTIKLIVDHYPVEGIKKLGGKHQVIFINTPWDIKFFKIGGKTMTLNRIEQWILRTEFSEPRIHFALNCASISCPKLRREAYAGNKLDEQLTQQTVEFLSDKSRNNLDAKNPKLSSIFSWYGSDMKKWSGKTLIAFINQYSEIKINEDAEINYLDYDWDLNDQK